MAMASSHETLTVTAQKAEIDRAGKQNNAQGVEVAHVEAGPLVFEH